MMNSSETLRNSKIIDSNSGVFLEDFIKNASTEVPDWNELIAHISDAIYRVVSTNSKLCEQSVKKLYELTHYRDTDLHKKISSIATQNGINASRITSFSDLPFELTSKISKYLNFEDASNLAFTSRCHLTLQKEYIINAANFGRQLNELGFTSPDKAIDFAIKFQLGSVNLFGFENISNNCLKRLSENLPELNQLVICSSSITNAGLAHLSQLHLLNSLDLSFCGSITDTGLEHLSNLTFLELLGLSDCSRITDEGLGHLSKLSLLKSLDLTFCRNITDAGLKHSSKLTSLESLKILYFSRITDTGLEHISELSLLKSLDLSVCVNITDAGLVQLSKLISLELLNISFCRQITDVGLEHISKLSMLKSLNLKNCKQITDTGLEHLSKLTLLQSLTLDGCDKITDAGLEHLSKLSSLTIRT
ncbi:MAG: hypothetical protein VX777_02700 [Chlamydiota bacterium]|nr:hypothetical protein [Chlamydiota bacterium]